MKITDNQRVLRFFTGVLLFIRGACWGSFVAAVLWLAISSAVFRFRHPWASETEVILHIPDAIMLRQVPYAEMRPRP